MSGAFPLDGLDNGLVGQDAGSVEVDLVLPAGRQVHDEALTGILLNTSAKQEMQSS